LQKQLLKPAAAGELRSPRGAHAWHFYEQRFRGQPAARRRHRGKPIKDLAETSTAWRFPPRERWNIAPGLRILACTWYAFTAKGAPDLPDATLHTWPKQKDPPHGDATQWIRSCFY
jgi:hypothetical protein